MNGGSACLKEPRNGNRSLILELTTPTTSAEELRAWFAGNLPDDWFTEPVAIRFDRDEIVVHGTLAPPAVDGDTSETLAWTVRLVVENESGWLNELREAMTSVEEVRKQGPTSRR